jgi:hypothetical protein
MRDHEWLFSLVLGTIAEFVPDHLQHQAARSVMRLHLVELDRARLEWTLRQDQWRALEHSPRLDVQQRSQVRQIQAICKQLLEHS